MTRDRNGAPRTLRRLAGLAVVGLACNAVAVRSAAADNQHILGKLFVVTDPTVGVDFGKRKITVIGKEAASPNTIVGDPLTNGATLDIIAVGGPTYEQTFTIPPGAGGSDGIPGWKALKSGSGFVYKDTLGVNGPVKVAQIKKSSKGQFLVKAVVLGKLGPGPQPRITVVPPAPGTVAGYEFQINGGDKYCSVYGEVAGGAVVNSPLGSQTFADGSKKFQIKDATTEIGCPNGD